MNSACDCSRSHSAARCTARSTPESASSPCEPVPGAVLHAHDHRTRQPFRAGSLHCIGRDYAHVELTICVIPVTVRISAIDRRADAGYRVDALELTGGIEVGQQCVALGIDVC